MARTSHSRRPTCAFSAVPSMATPLRWPTCGWPKDESEASSIWASEDADRVRYEFGPRNERPDQINSFAHVIRRAEPESAEEGKVRTCGVEPGGVPMRIPPSSLPFEDSPVANDGPPPSNHFLVAKIAIDSTVEMFTRFGSRSAVAQWLASLVGAGSAIYQRDINAAHQIAFLRIWVAEPDPYTGGGASTDTRSTQLEAEWQKAAPEGRRPSRGGCWATVVAGNSVGGLRRSTPCVASSSASP